MTDTPTFFVTNYDPNFGHYKPEDDFLHPAANEAVENYACTETQYLGFNIPEACISGVGYMWHHPHMQTVLAGAVAYQGVKRQFIAAELCDIRSFMSDEVLKNDLHEVSFDSGYRTQVIDPGKQFRIRYDDPARKNHFDVTLTAIMPPAMWPTGRHLEQAMKTKGELTLRGEHFTVNGYFVRDRSWGEARSERIMPIPVTSWMTGVFNDDFAFNCNALDHPDLNPVWKPYFDVKPENTLIGGWVWRNGELTAIRAAKKRVHYDLATMIPKSVDLTFTDAKDRTFEMHGTILSAAPFNCWMNVNAPICLTRWECNGLTGHGDTQDIQWNDFVQACAGK
jgi:hypothetical protein